MAAPVLLPALLVGFAAERLFLPGAGGPNVIRRNASAHQRLFYGGGAAVAERKVVLGGTSLIAVAFHIEAHVGVLLQEARVGCDLLLRLRPKVEAVVIEEHVLNVLGK